MKAVLQRVLNTTLKIDGEIYSEIGQGLCVYLGFAPTDTKAEVDYIIDRIGKIRIFEDENGKMNLDVKTINGEVILIPNFTLYADTSSRRPSFCAAMKPSKAEILYEYACSKFDQTFFKAKRGVFGADMKITSLVDGPINIVLEKCAKEEK